MVAVHECLETLKTDKNAHNLGRAAKLLVKLAYLKTPNRIHIAKQSEVIELLVKYLSHDKEFLRVLCAQALMIIAHENEACKTAITKAGAVATSMHTAEGGLRCQSEGHGREMYLFIGGAPRGRTESYLGTAARI